MKYRKKDAELFKNLLDHAAAFIVSVSVSSGVLGQAKVRGMLCSCVAIIDKVKEEIENETVSDM